MNPSSPSLPLLAHRLALAALVGALPLRSMPRAKVLPPRTAADGLELRDRPIGVRLIKPGWPILDPLGTLPNNPVLRLVPVALTAPPPAPLLTGPALGSGCRF